MKPLVIALTKGRLEKSTLKLFEAAGIDVSFMADKQRKLTFTSPDGAMQFILVKANDVVTYVRHGVADLGVVGKDTLIEQRYGYYEMLDLAIGKCRFCVASTANFDPASYRRKVIATKYPTVAAEHFRAQGQEVEIIKIEGSVELAPILGLADAIVDIVETGSTLRDNGLAIVEEICPISGRLIVNKAALKRKQARILPLLDQLETVIGGEVDAN